VSLSRALLLLIALVLVAALVPAGILLERRLSGAIEARAWQDLEAAPALLAESRAQSADAMMMHAKEIASTAGLGQALVAGNESGALRLVEAARGSYGEDAVLLTVDGRSLAGPRPPSSLVGRALDGQMPVEVVGDGVALRTIALAPIMIDSSVAGIAGVATSIGETEARAMAGLTRSDVVILDDAGRVAAGTAAEKDTAVIAAAGRVARDASIRAVGAEGRLLVLATPLSGFATAVLVRDLARDRAIIGTLRRIALASASFAALLALVLGSLFAMRLSRPVSSLASAADRLAAGDFHAPIERPAIAELGRMAVAFESMRTSLASRIDELASANRELADRQARLTALQAELIQRDRLAAAGQLVALLAHEIRNPVANVRNCLEVIRRRMPSDPESRQFVDLAIDELLRMHELAEQMLDLNRPRDEGLMESDPSSIVNEVVKLARLGAPPTLEIRVDAAANGNARIAPDALKQVLLNLVRNAREAVREHGRIDIRLHDWNGSVVIDVLDSGPGIPGDILSRVFDPFFTTKGGVQGVGLGLFVAEGIVRGVGGRIVAGNRSDGPTGAVFTVTVPATSGTGESKTA
jgi:signal transduction histidine kinase